VLGPAAGGALIALTHKAAVVYAINAAATLVCLALIALVRSRQTVIPRTEMSLESLLAGFKFVYQTKIILGTITLDLFAVLLGGATALLPVYAKDILRAGPTGLGILQAALPLGSVVSAFYLAHRPPLERILPAPLIRRGRGRFGLGSVASIRVWIVPVWFLGFLRKCLF
jgi:hypothetical protein